MKATALLLACAAALSGCGTAPTTDTQPDRFNLVHSGRVQPAQQARLMNCIFDGFLSAQKAAAGTHVRQIKRADGYRVDVFDAAAQYLVADIRDDGTYEVRQIKNLVFLNLQPEETASMACLKSLGATDIAKGKAATPD